MIAMSRGFGLWTIAAFIAATGVGTLAWRPMNTAICTLQDRP